MKDFRYLNEISPTIATTDNPADIRTPRELEVAANYQKAVKELRGASGGWTDQPDGDGGQERPKGKGKGKDKALDVADPEKGKPWWEKKKDKREAAGAGADK